jgi:glucose/arabinose dehydrogenase
MYRLLFVFLLITLVGCTVTTPTALPTEPIPTKTPLLAPSKVPSSTSSPPTAQPSNAGELPDPESASWVLVADGFERPLDVQDAGDERLFVVEQRGLIWVLEDGKRIPDPFLDIQQQVNDRANEQGLLGLAFHPNYLENGYFFINYTDSQARTVIARFEISPDADVVDPESQRIILQFEQPYRNHNGGGLAFGPDGYLYIGTGDGGSGGDPLGNGQRLDTYLGKMLRIDVDEGDPYAIPSDNPFLSGDGLPEIWAYGLRNPWRFAFDSLTGGLFIGDVGQGEWEEINFQSADDLGGANYGWNIREGAHPYAGETTQGLIDPVAEYSHQEGVSVTGGFVMRDATLPEWEGIYVYGDFGSGLIWGLIRDEQDVWQSKVLFETNFNISSFGQDADGHLYLTDFRSGGLYRLDRSTSTN